MNMKDKTGMGLLNNVNVLDLAKQLHERLNSDFTALDHDGVPVTEDLRYWFHEEDPKAKAEVMDMIQQVFGESGQYIFWYLYQELGCPSGADIAEDMTKHLRMMADI